MAEDFVFLFGDVTVPVLRAAVAIEEAEKRKTISHTAVADVAIAAGTITHI